MILTQEPEGLRTGCQGACVATSVQCCAARRRTSQAVQSVESVVASWNVLTRVMHFGKPERNMFPAQAQQQLKTTQSSRRRPVHLPRGPCCVAGPVLGGCPRDTMLNCAGRWQAHDRSLNIGALHIQARPYATVILALAGKFREAFPAPPSQADLLQVS